VSEITDALAQTASKRYPRKYPTPESWYRTHIEGVTTGGEPIGSLKQLAPYTPKVGDLVHMPTLSATPIRVVRITPAGEFVLDVNGRPELFSSAMFQRLVVHPGEPFANADQFAADRLVAMWHDAQNVSSFPQRETAQRFPIGTVSPIAAAKIKAEIGEDVSGLQHTIRLDVLRHTFNEHGNAATEIARGNLPLTDSEIARIPDVLANPDSVIKVADSSTGLKRFALVKAYPDHVVYVEEIGNRKNGLVAVSVRVMPAKWNPSTLFQTVGLFPANDGLAIPRSDARSNPGLGPTNDIMTGRGETFKSANPHQAGTAPRYPSDADAFEAPPQTVRLTRDTLRAAPVESIPYKGAMSFHPQTGRAIIHALQNPDASTALHEIGHVLVHTLEDSDLEAVERWNGGKLSQWSIAQHERFARAWERYLRMGQAPTYALQSAFTVMKEALRQIYLRIKGSPIDVPINKELRAVFDRSLGKDVSVRLPSGLENLYGLTLEQRRRLLEKFWASNRFG
jgi:hypothetical protein